MKIYWFIQDLKNVLINWEKCNNSYQCGETGSRRINSRCKAPIFSKNQRKIAEINRNKRKFLRNFPTGGDFFKKSPIFLFLPKFLRNLVKFTDISFIDISPPFFVSPTPETQNFGKKNRNFHPWYRIQLFSMLILFLDFLRYFILKSRIRFFWGR